MKSLEYNDNVKFYIKLPGWFKIDTPLGGYNPDWAIALGDERIVYFTAETKGTNNINDESLRSSERAKILSGFEHFRAIGASYVAPVNSLTAAISRLYEEN